MVMRVRAWDLASTEGGDYTVGTRWAANSSGYWIEDVVRERRNADDVPELVAAVATADGPMVEQLFEEETGASGKLTVSFMRRMLDQIPNAGSVWPAPTEQNKTVRAWPLCAQTKAGRVHLAPDFHHAEAMTEMEEWPDSSNDDVIDSMAHGVNYLAPLVEGLVGSGWTPGSAAV
jgi:predicted phage terminase large subunit-like protein